MSKGNKRVLHRLELFAPKTVIEGYLQDDKHYVRVTIEGGTSYGFDCSPYHNYIQKLADQLLAHSLGRVVYEYNCTVKPKENKP